MAMVPPPRRPLQLAGGRPISQRIGGSCGSGKGAAYNNGMTCWPAHNDPKHWAAVALAQGVAVTRGSGSNTKTIYFHNVP
jgi:hypothetical protein